MTSGGPRAVPFRSYHRWRRFGSCGYLTFIPQPFTPSLKFDLAFPDRCIRSRAYSALKAIRKSEQPIQQTICRRKLRDLPDASHCRPDTSCKSLAEIVTRLPSAAQNPSAVLKLRCRTTSCLASQSTGSDPSGGIAGGEGVPCVSTGIDDVRSRVRPHGLAVNGSTGRTSFLRLLHRQMDDGLKVSRDIRRVGFVARRQDISLFARQVLNVTKDVKRLRERRRWCTFERFHPLLRKVPTAFSKSTLLKSLFLLGVDSGRDGARDLPTRAPGSRRRRRDSRALATGKHHFTYIPLLYTRSTCHVGYPHLNF